MTNGWHNGSLAEPKENTCTMRVSGTNGDAIEKLYNYLKIKAQHGGFAEHGAGAAIDEEIDMPEVHKNWLGKPRKHDAERDGLFGFNITMVSRRTDKSPSEIIDAVLKNLNITVDNGAEHNGVSIHQFGDDKLYQAALAQCNEMYRQ